MNKPRTKTRQTRKHNNNTKNNKKTKIIARETHKNKNHKTMKNINKTR